MKWVSRFTLSGDPTAAFRWCGAEEQADGSVEVTFAVPDLNWAASIVLSYGGWAVVAGPPELREIVRDWATHITALHQANSGW